MYKQEPIIIVGAGVVGLTLAHGLQNAGIPFEIYERDSRIDARGQGWAITLHWVLPFLKQLLSPAIYAELDTIQVDPDVGGNDTGNFLFINLATEEVKFRIPPNFRRRISREKLRGLLLRDVSEHVHWSKRLIDLHHDPSTGKVTVYFDDGTQAHSSLVVGAEGSNSQTRRFLCPTTYSNNRLPIRFVGTAVDMTPDQVRPLRELDPLLFQGCHPDTGSFLWISMLETPAVNGSEGTDHEYYRVQVNVSWPVESVEDEVPSNQAERLVRIQAKAKGFAPRFKAAVDAIPQTAEVTEIMLADWPCLEWDGQGAVTLLGDAAHAMTMYRGEAANHGILDAYMLREALVRTRQEKMALADAIAMYENEMRERTQTAVLLSRQACFDAHDWYGLNENSAVLKRRAIKGV